MFDWENGVALFVAVADFSKPLKKMSYYIVSFLFIIIHILSILCNVYDFPEYNDEKLSVGPHLLFEEEWFSKTKPGEIHDVTLESWVFLNDW
jgi:hypothetical protein